MASKKKAPSTSTLRAAFASPPPTPKPKKQYGLGMKTAIASVGAAAGAALATAFADDPDKFFEALGAASESMPQIKGLIAQSGSGGLDAERASIVTFLKTLPKATKLAVAIKKIENHAHHKHGAKQAASTTETTIGGVDVKVTRTPNAEPMKAVKKTKKRRGTTA